MREDYGNILFRVRVQNDRVRYTLLGWILLAEIPVQGATVEFQKETGKAFLRDSSGKRIRLRGIGLDDIASLSKLLQALDTLCGETSVGTDILAAKERQAIQQRIGNPIVSDSRKHDFKTNRSSL